MIVEKIIASLAAKAIFSGGKYVYDNSGERRRRKEAVEHYGNRTLVEIGILYSVGFFICNYLMKKGILGIVFVLFGFLGKYTNLREASVYVYVNREKKAMVVVGVLLVISFLMNKM